MGRSYSALNIIPLLVFPLVIYNFVVLTGVANGNVGAWMNEPIFTVGMFSGDNWGVSFADCFTGFSLLLLFVEIVKSTQTGSSSIINHGLSMLLAVVCIIQFITIQGFSNSVFFMLTLMTIVDVIAGFTITIVGAKRDFGSSGGIAGTH